MAVGAMVLHGTAMGFTYISFNLLTLELSDKQKNHISTGYIIHDNASQTQWQSILLWQSRASPGARCSRCHPSRTCWTPTWVFAPAGRVTSRSVHRWTRGSLLSHRRSHQTSGRRALRTEMHRRKGRSCRRSSWILRLTGAPMDSPTAHNKLKSEWKIL